MAKHSPKTDHASVGRRSSRAGSKSSDHSVQGLLQSRSVRETVESVVIAIVLALLFRTFVAEPFVIPTGSMAPTLQGRHQRVTCPICEFPYRVGTSQEDDHGYIAGHNYLATCPQCGFIACTNPKIGEQASRSITSDGKFEPIFTPLTLDRAKMVQSSGGDRILVSKSAYEFEEPQRWDVFVFHFPGEAKKNYIKRLVGLPGETVRLKFGDVFRSPDVEANEHSPQANFEILRKPASVLLKMRQLVYDNDFAASPGVVEFMTNRDWPTRWSDNTSRWQSQDNKKSFQVEGGEDTAWLRYRHYLASLEDWKNLLSEEELPAPGVPSTSRTIARPQLITDGYAYNAGAFARLKGPNRFTPIQPGSQGMNWIGDLVLDCQLESSSDTGTAIIELVEGGFRFQCHLDVKTGQASLKIIAPDGSQRSFEAEDEKPAAKQPVASTSFQGAGSHQITFANVDDKLYLWIDEESIEFDSPTSYPRLDNTAPTAKDLEPVGIASQGAKLRVDGLKLYRDVYYIASHGQNQLFCDLKNSNLNKYMAAGANNNMRADFDAAAKLTRERAKFFSLPSEWKGAYTAGNMYELTFSMKRFEDSPSLDQFFALGDNSPSSQDSRLWWKDTRYPHIKHFVERKLIIGRAMLIYWPVRNMRFIQ